MEKYDPKTIEQPLYRRWESEGYFAPSGGGEAFSIAIPPPNVTGTLHMGHAFQHSLVDAVIHRKRMQGYKTLWQIRFNKISVLIGQIVFTCIQCL